MAIVVLFSVFEAQVREWLTESIEPHLESITEPILRDAADNAAQGVREGSFYRRVLEPLKKQHRIAADAVTQVDQIRDYRNWVAHGRRGDPINQVTPTIAHARLKAFLAALEIAAEPEEVDSNRSSATND